MKTLLCGLMMSASLLVASPVFAISDANKPPRPSVGLALGSGGAVGLAHIAMLQVFDDLGIKPDRITGTSIGAVIGALYAAGLRAAEIRDIFDEFGGSRLDALSRLIQLDTESAVTEILQVDIGEGGLIDSSGFLSFLAEKIEARMFEDLVIPLEVVATDYWTGETVILRQGDLFAAIEASMAVPGLFSPVRRGTMLLVDGGASNPLPYDLLTGRHDLIVAIDVTGSRAPEENDRLGFTDVFFSTLEIMQQSIITEKLRRHRPDIYIKPETSNIRLLEFNRIETILHQSRPSAENLRRQLREFLDDKSAENDRTQPADR